MTKRMTKEEVIDALVAHDLEVMEESVVADMLREGCPGYEGQDNDELILCYQEQIDDEEIEIVEVKA